jgi:uncharacterized protein YecT (DUF1311 family)
MVMLRIEAIVIVATALLATSPTSAQSSKQLSARYSTDYKQCMSSGDAAQGVTSGILDCNGSEIERQDARLNQAYKMVMTRLSPDSKAILRGREREWITQRDAGCHKISDPKSGNNGGNYLLRLHSRRDDKTRHLARVL